MVLFFQLIFAWAEPAMNAIDGAVGAAQAAVRAALPAGLAADFLADGVLAGVGSVIVFLPQILMLFAVLYLLEDVGYMARAAFVVDRVMGRIGLEGRAFVALLSSYACAVPGIMATRTIASPRNRLVTILVAPLMTCSARLPVYALLIGAFVPARAVLGPIGLQGLVLLGLYLLGALAARRPWRRSSKRTLVRGEALPVLPRAAALPHARRSRLVAPSGVGRCAGVPAPRGHDHPRRLDRALGACSRSRAASRRRRPLAGRGAAAHARRAERRRAHRPRDRAAPSRRSASTGRSASGSSRASPRAR